MKDSKAPNNPQEEARTLNRRELLKALAAAGGALATTAFLPRQWSKPDVEVGALPAHALQTPTAFQMACALYTERGRELPDEGIIPGTYTLYGCGEVFPNWPNIPVHIRVAVDGTVLADWFGYTKPDGVACTGTFTHTYVHGDVITLEAYVVGMPGSCRTVVNVRNLR